MPSDLPNALRQLPRPSIGRVVHYFDSFGPYDRRGGAPEVTPKAAIITHVHDEDTVDLTVMYGSRNRSMQLVSVIKATGDDKAGRWDWPARV